MPFDSPNLSPSDTGEERSPVVVISPPGAWPTLGVRELWRYRDLLSQIVWRDFSAMYRQSVIGIAWAVITPVVTMIVFSVVFGKMARIPSDGIPYPLFTFTGLLPWTYFAACLTGASNSTVTGGHLLTKVYFPRLILPLSKVVNGLIAFAIQFVLLLVLLVWYQVPLTSRAFALPLLVLICAVSGLSVGLWLTALSVKYRDVKHIVPFLSRMWMWVSPVVYPASLAAEEWRVLYWLNPMVGVIEGFRWAILGKLAPDWTMLAISLTGVVAMLVGGLYFFRKAEATFADTI